MTVGSVVKKHYWLTSILSLFLAKIQGRPGFGRRSRRRRNWALGLRNSLKVNRSVGGNGNLEAIEEASVAPPDDESHLHDKVLQEICLSSTRGAFLSLALLLNENVSVYRAVMS